MYFTYILWSESRSKFYVGSTQDLVERMKVHNNGQVKWTSTGTPWVVVYSESWPDRTTAVRRERQIKSWKSAVAIRKLIDEAAQR